MQVITAALAALFPFAHPGDVVLSFRDIGAIAVLDPRQRKIVWALRGPGTGSTTPGCCRTAIS
ncbi:MAG: hypothetical protein KGJ55_06715 [Gammaproteobacteria bacterium]|nr:hypothetical protein [Gammaproteobacteria bacterium]